MVHVVLGVRLAIEPSSVLGEIELFDELGFDLGTKTDDPLGPSQRTDLGSALGKRLGVKHGKGLVPKIGT